MAGLRVPEADPALRVPRDEMPAIRREGECRDERLRPEELGTRLPEGPAVPGIDDLDVSRLIIQGDPPAVGRDGQGRQVAMPSAPLAVVDDPLLPAHLRDGGPSPGCEVVDDQ